MKILQRYVLNELWLPFILCFVVLNFIFMGGYLVKAAGLIIGRSVPLSDTLYVLMLALPAMISYTVPTSLLTAVLVVFGNFSQNNEIRAVKASGVHIIHVIMPALILGMGFSLAMFVFNDQIASNSEFQLRKTTKQMLIKHPMAVIEPGRFVKLDDNITFLTKKLEGKLMRDIVAYENEGANKPVRTIIAERGEITTSEGGSQMQIRLFDGSISDTDEESVQSLQFETYEFPPLGQEDIRKMQKKKKDLALAEILVQLQRENLSEDTVLELWNAFHERISFAFGSFIFVFLGIPIAMLVRRGEIVLSFGISMAAACLYYVLFVGAKALSIEGVADPAIAYWAPNIFLFAVGFFLLRKALVN